MKVNCPACGHSVELDEAYDDFEGQIRCWVCRAVFEIKTDQLLITPNDAQFIDRRRTGNSL